MRSASMLYGSEQPPATDPSHSDRTHLLAGDQLPSS